MKGLKTLAIAVCSAFALSGIALGTVIDFDDLTGSVFEGHRQPLKVWILCLYFMGLNLSNLQIAAELCLNKDDVQQMTRTLRKAVAAKRPQVRLEGEVECDEVYVVAGHKGRPAAVKKKGADPAGDA